MAAISIHVSRPRALAFTALLFCAALAFPYMLYGRANTTARVRQKLDPSSFGAYCDPGMTVATVACGDRLEEALTLFQSVVMLSGCDMTFIMLVDAADLQSTRSNMTRILRSSTFAKPHVRIVVQEALYPMVNATTDGVNWKALFRPCASLRLFFPTMFPAIDALIYLDSDTLMVSPIEDFWNNFDSMRDTEQLATLIPEHEQRVNSYYNHFRHVPYVPPFGVNSGIMMMNLTRMRDWQWETRILSTFRQYRRQLRLHDQDILNVIFHNSPEKLLVLPCIWNFRTFASHCNTRVAHHCVSAFEEGVPKILHGNAKAMHVDMAKQQYLSVIYEAFKNFTFPNSDDDVFRGFIEPLERSIAHRVSTQPYCSPLDLPLVEVLREIVTASQLNRATRGFSVQPTAEGTRRA